MAHIVKALATKSEDVSAISGHHLIGERVNSARCPLTPAYTKLPNNCDKKKKNFKGPGEMVQLVGEHAPKPGPEFEHQSPHRGQRELTPTG